MDLGQAEGPEEPWQVPASLVRRIWKIAKMAEWSGWNSKWRARCCPMCGGPESGRQHAQGCYMQDALDQLEERYPQVTEPIPLDPIEQLEADALERLMLGEIEDDARGGDGPEKPYWRD